MSYFWVTVCSVYPTELNRMHTTQWTHSLLTYRTWIAARRHHCGSFYQLEYLAVYGRASMAAFRQLSTHGQQFDPESLYEPMKFETLHPYLVNKICDPRKCGPKLTKFFQEMLLHKTPKQPKFRQNWIKMPEISTIKNFCSPKKLASDMFLSRTETWLLESRLASGEWRE